MDNIGNPASAQDPVTAPATTVQPQYTVSATPAPAPDSAVPVTPAPITSKPVVVLIEDDGLILRMYEKKLALDGYEVRAATNGKDGLELIKQVKPALILCDVMMPEMNGFEVLQAVKADMSLATIPFIMLTNLSESEDAQRAVEMGATTYLVKANILPADVIGKVKEVLKATGADAIPQGVAVNS